MSREEDTARYFYGIPNVSQQHYVNKRSVINTYQRAMSMASQKHHNGIIYHKASHEEEDTVGYIYGIPKVSQPQYIKHISVME